MRRYFHPILLTLVVFSACSPENKSREHIQGLESAAGHQKYEIGVACMQYILKHGNDLSYSKTLLKKLLDIGFPAECIYAAEWLLQKYPNDPELFYFRGIAYRSQHQYGMSQNDLKHALSFEPGNSKFIREAEITAEQHSRWLQVQSLNEALRPPADSFDILLNRAEQFFVLKEYDAALYDLGSISKMRRPEDSIYYARKVSVLYTASQKPVETLGQILEYFKGLER